MKPLAHSFSSVNMYDTCPHQFQQLRLLKNFSDGNKFSFAGQEEHKALELRLKRNKKLPSHLAGMEDMCAKLQAMPGFLEAEYQMAVTKDKKGCSWFSSGAWYRSIADVLIHNEKRALVVDWKTGKRRPKISQLATLAACTMTHFSDVDRVDAMFLWIKTREVDKYTFHRKDMDELWGHVLPLITKIEWSHQKNIWPCKPNGLCREYCKVTTCEHNGK